MKVRALLAERLADVVDRAAGAGDEAGMSKAADRLLEVMADLFPSPKGGAPGGADGGRGNVVRLLDSPPQVGDSSHA